MVGLSGRPILNAHEWPSQEVGGYIRRVVWLRCMDLTKSKTMDLTKVKTIDLTKVKTIDFNQVNHGFNQVNYRFGQPPSIIGLLFG